VRGEVHLVERAGVKTNHEQTFFCFLKSAGSKSGAMYFCRCLRSPILSDKRAQACPLLFPLILLNFGSRGVFSAPEVVPNVHAEDSVGETPLHWACEIGNNDIAAMLRANGTVK
jgi:ankyrin repeat protein